MNLKDRIIAAHIHVWPPAPARGERGPSAGPVTRARTSVRGASDAKLWPKNSAWPGAPAAAADAASVSAVWPHGYAR